MTTVTVAELIKEIRKPGKVLVPVLMNGDVVHLVAEKTDLLEYFARNNLRPSDTAPWAIINRDASGLWLDTI